MLDLSRILLFRKNRLESKASHNLCEEIINLLSHTKRSCQLK